MEIWLDTVDPDTIVKALRLGLLHGITTNPSIIAEQQRSLEHILESLLAMQRGPIAVQVTAEFTAGQVAQAKRLFAASPRIIVKVPVTVDGLQTIRELRAEGIPTMATAIFQPKQVLTAAMAGATYLAPYIRGIHDYLGQNPFDALEAMQAILTTYQLPSKLLAASLRTSDDIVRCCQVGIAAITLKTSVFEDLIADTDATRHHVDKFASDWKHASHSNLLH